jgi:N-acetylmuramoyl-L-alanine amidase
MILIRITWSGKYLANGMAGLNVELMNGSKVVDRLTGWSGLPRLQNERYVHPSEDYPRSGRPIPESVYTIGKFITQDWNEPGIAFEKVPLDVLPAFKVNARSDLLFHWDANWETALGSLGCVVNSDKRFMKTIKAWLSSDARPTHCVVDWGVGFLESVPEYAPFKASLEAVSPTKPATPGQELPIEKPTIPQKPDGEGTSWNNLVSTYKDVLIEFNVLKAVTLAQWMLETGRGTSKLCKTFVNFAGLKCRKDIPSIRGVSCAIYDEGRGETDKNYFKCENVRIFLELYWAFLERSVYAGWKDAVRSATNPGEVFINFIASKGYAGDPDYAQKVLALVPETEKLLDGKPSPLKSLVGVRVGIDVGHGFQDGQLWDPGTAGPGISEYELNKLQSVEIKSTLERMGATVSVFDYDQKGEGTTLVGKGSKAKGQHVFVSLHHNSADSVNAQGSEVLVEDNHWTIEDKSLAGTIFTELEHLVPEMNKPYPRRGVKLQGLGVLTGADGLCRAKCLVESYFVSQKGLTRDRCVELSTHCAKAIANGIALYATANKLGD